MLNFIKQNEEWVKKAQELFNIQQKRKALEALEEVAKTELKAITGDVNSVGGGYKYEATIRAGSVDYASIPQLKGVNVNMYRKADVVMWKLTYVGDITEEMGQ